MRRLIKNLEIDGYDCNQNLKISDENCPSSSADSYESDTFNKPIIVPYMLGLSNLLFQRRKWSYFLQGCSMSMYF